jgi:antitoxin (DNA-binding transcriptional repressor) of toxin-antitoxin stability system
LRVENGEELILAHQGIPIAKLIPFHPTPNRRSSLGLDQGRFTIPEDFNTLPPEILTTFKEQLLQEIETTPDAVVENLLSLIQTLKANPDQPILSYTQLLDRVDYLEAIVGIRQGLEEHDRGEGIPAEQATLNI